MIGWLDCQAGASGDMLLGALVGAGVPLEVLQAEVDRLGLGVELAVEQVTRAGLGATRVSVRVGGVEADQVAGAADADQVPGTASADQVPGTAGEALRTWRDVRGLLEERLEEPALPLEVFRRLAEAEAAVHGTDPEQVHFHEVGAVDALADVVGVCAGFRHLGLTALTCSPVGLGSGSTRTAHGTLPVPVPAVLALLRGAPVEGGPAGYESTTPTGAALLATLATDWGGLPPMTLDRTGVGAGSRDSSTHPNATRLVLGHPTASEQTAILLETNVDDLDPRLWPHVLGRLLAEGASDAWLTPVLMKKGRPAHTLSVLCRSSDAAALRSVVFRETTAIGLRESPVAKHALARTVETVDVDGEAVRVKIAWDGATAVNLQPEWEDVRAAAAALGRPAKDVLQTCVKKASAPTPPASGTPTTS